MDVILCTGAVCLFQQNFIIPLGEDDIGVGAPDLADAGTGLRGDLRPDIELRLVMLDGNGDTVRLRQCDGVSGDGLINVRQQL